MTISRMQQPRQQYGLGSIVKKAVKGVSKGIKKFAKSDIGKMAIMAGIGFGIPGTSIGGLFGRSATGMFGGAKGLLGGYGFKPSMLNAASKLGLGTFENVGGNRIFQSKGLLKGLTSGQAALGIGAASTLAGILASDADMTEEEAEQLKQDPVALKNYLTLYYSNLNPNASKEEVESFVRTNMYADGGRVNYGMGSNPGIKAPRASMIASPHTGNMQAPGRVPPSMRSSQLGSPQGGTSLYGDVLEYLKRQGKNAPQRISPEEIPGTARPFMPYGGGSFNPGGGAINTPMPPVGGGPGTGMLQPPSSPAPSPAPSLPNNMPPAIKEVDPLLKELYERNYDAHKNVIAKAAKGDLSYVPHGDIVDLFRRGSLGTEDMSDAEVRDAMSKIRDSQIYIERINGTPVYKEREIDFGLYVPTLTEYLLDKGEIKTDAKSLQDVENYKFKDYDDMLDSVGSRNQYEKQLRTGKGTIVPYAMDIFKKYKERTGYAMGSPEQNAMQAAGIMDLPLNKNKAGVTELDLRKSGGFIPPVGVKEKADDIPAMLSNNEFVFTADAVRGMGDGNVNKGAQRMYDMMKKLEEGGRV